MTSTTDRYFDDCVTARLPLPYPTDEESYRRVWEVALRRQARALEYQLSRSEFSVTMLVRRANDLAGRELLDATRFAGMRIGDVVMSPRTAVALAGVLHVRPFDVLPHVEAFPWLGGAYRSHLAGREWISIAAMFDDAVIGAFDNPGGTAQADRTIVGPVETSEGVVDIRSIMDRISSRMADTTAKSHPVDLEDGETVSSDETTVSVSSVPSSNEGAVAVPSVPSSDENDVTDISPRATERHEDEPCGAPETSVMRQPSDGTLMSLTCVSDGVRFVYNGVMEQWRVEALDEVLSMNLMPFTGSDRFSTEILAGRDRRLVRCDLVVDVALAPRIVSVIGRSRPRARWWSVVLGGA